MWWAYKRFGLEKRGLLGGLFLSGYAVARSIGECFREPDAQIGYLPGGITMGQLLCVPMLLIGIWVMRTARKPS
jgi:phosphatidylglycerol:prolipoprotein diacylglycerol transferase